MVYAGELRQIAANLLGNALDATSRNGRIFLRERIATDWSTGRQGIRITVADTGHGMDTDTLHRAFDAFFSTKSSTGTGLGLWVIKEIIGKHAGRIRVRSSQKPLHRGTVFTVFLPEIASLPSASESPTFPETAAMQTTEFSDSSHRATFVD
jgi:signal transduction histidine kinase